jgi:hypothetical protein
MTRRASVRGLCCTVMVVAMAMVFSRADAAAQATPQPDATTPTTCACPDGRTFAVGQAVFGLDSSRVVIEGLTRATSTIEGVARCDALLVAAQDVRKKRDGRDRPYVERIHRTRGRIPGICATKIRFRDVPVIDPIIGNDGVIVVLNDEELLKARTTNPSAAREVPDLTGKDLTSLVDAAEPTIAPASRSTPATPTTPATPAIRFDDVDLKEGAYVIVRIATRAPLAEERPRDANVQEAHRSVRLAAGTLGRIAGSGGVRYGRGRWLVDVWANSVPRPFWRTLAFFWFADNSQKTAVLEADKIVEINAFFDKYQIATTHFGDEGDESADEAHTRAADLDRLPTIIARQFVVRPRTLTPPQPQAQWPPPRSCRCPNGQVFSIGDVAYADDSSRMMVVGIRERPNACEVELRIDSLQTHGNPYGFFITRNTSTNEGTNACYWLGTWRDPGLRPRDGRTYEFVYDGGSKTISEMTARLATVARQAASPRVDASNDDLLTAIAPDTPGSIAITTRKAPTLYPHLKRRAWVLARRNLRAHQLGIVDEPGGESRVVPLKDTTFVKAGHLGQIESVLDDRYAVVRVYRGSRIDRFGQLQNAFNRVARASGGTRPLGTDDFFAREYAEILRIPVIDLINVHDYLDRSGATSTSRRRSAQLAAASSKSKGSKHADRSRRR